MCGDWSRWPPPQIIKLSRALTWTLSLIICIVYRPQVRLAIFPCKLNVCASLRRNLRIYPRVQIGWLSSLRFSSSRSACLSVRQTTWWFYEIIAILYQFLIVQEERCDTSTGALRAPGKSGGNSNWKMTVSTLYLIPASEKSRWLPLPQWYSGCLMVTHNRLGLLIRLQYHSIGSRPYH